jgi:hypothetical protein
MMKHQAKNSLQSVFFKHKEKILEMRKIITLIIALLLFSCSSESDSFTFDAVLKSSTVNVDQSFLITVSSKENIMGVRYSFDNFQSGLAVFSDTGYGTSKDLHFKFLTIGKKTIYIKLIKAGNIESETKAINITVEKGNSVRITGLKITSFDGINTVWDSEFDKSNPNSLADVCFSFSKVASLNAFGEEGTIQEWFKTPIKENQGDLKWSFPTDDLYVDANGYLIFYIYDQDGPNLVQVLSSSVNVPHIYLSPYASTKPASIDVSFPESNVKFTLDLEWPK